MTNSISKSTSRPVQPHHHPATPSQTSGKAAGVPGSRDSFDAGSSGGARHLNGVLDRLDVQHSRRWQPTGRPHTRSRVTHCNEFAQTALHRLGVPTPGGNANAMNHYFNHAGRAQGWHAVSAAEAQRMANQGHAVVASWRNPTGDHGHIAIVRPGEMGPGGPRIAQAGGHNYNNASMRQGFGRHTPQYFVHD